MQPVIDLLTALLEFFDRKHCPYANSIAPDDIVKNTNPKLLATCATIHTIEPLKALHLNSLLLRQQFATKSSIEQSHNQRRF